MNLNALKPLVPISTVAIVLLACGGITGGTLGDDCSAESDCAPDYSCVECSGQNSCYFDDMLESDSDFEWVCDQYGSGTPTDARYGGGGGGGGTNSGACGETDVWTCTYDGQATPMCQWACAHSGSERDQTCQVLAGMLESGNPGECCTVCR